jgi:hypothetical protein
MQQSTNFVDDVASDSALLQRIIAAKRATAAPPASSHGEVQRPVKKRKKKHVSIGTHMQCTCEIPP